MNVLATGVWSICTTGCPGLRAGLSAVLTREGLKLHKSLCACADRSTGVGGPSTGAKTDLDRDCVFLVECTTNYPMFEPGQH
jgi:hypothetical protein